MQDAINFVTNNWAAIIAVAAAVLVVADKVVALTPSKKDDEFVAKVEAALAVIGVKTDAK
ncbi:type IV secretory pathway component VirB8 [Rhizobium ruizarguesonis]